MTLNFHVLTVEATMANEDTQVITSLREKLTEQERIVKTLSLDFAANQESYDEVMDEIDEIRLNRAIDLHQEADQNI